ncbi:single-stranded-DNA-specific exonuclease RecJ [Marinicella litoralis]|uniref:Single-stranded-DNA-specific exonuclease RecJ n=1 Tax=Marinicella litoralis TaxID=644220 RepID=A0A4R6XVX3_9GAMM|nr:single-stranded-DNA-specific exonuclease RecJ [Marinicella litoralis]TDR22374.1 exonuclease RecJ [Marinicella litoralis]
MPTPKLQRRKVPDTPILGGDHLHHLIHRIYLARGITEFSEVEYRLKNLCRPDALNGIEVAAKIIIDAIAAKKQIVIVGDFDADGATSTALMIRGLHQMGASFINFMVPNRFEYGYGLTVELVDELEKIKAELLITVDNGISSYKGVAKAKSKGMDVIVTDHHLPPEALPPADAIVNPNCHGDEFPSKSLAGVGVAFYLLAAVRSQLMAQNWFEINQKPVPNLAHLFDLVALGTVADLVPLDGNNRIMVDAGLQLIKAKRSVPGINALFEVANVDQGAADSNSLAFYVAPRLNAAGRLEDMSIGINLLLTDDHAEAKVLAAQLNDINQQRKRIQQDMQIFADSVVDELKKKTSLPEVICLYHENWHQGVVGLLASKVKEYTHRPVIAFANENDDSIFIKGSARSIPGLHIRDVLVEIDAQQPGMITKFGGHAMAAGLTLPKDQLNTFQTAFSVAVKQHLGADTLQQIIYSDGSVDTEDLNLRMAEMLKDAGPWGQLFDQPLFDGWFVIKSKRLIGDNHCKLVLQTPDLIKQIDAIAFGFHPNQFAEEQQSTHLCYQMMVNEFRNRRTLQLKVDHILK